MRFAFIAAKRAEHRVTILCRCMRVTRSGFYAWLRRGLSTRARRDVVLRTKLRAFHAASGHRYGRPRLWKDLQEDGEAVSEKRVRRLMRDEQIHGRVPKRFKQTTNSDHTDPIAANVLARDFTVAAPNQRWVSDTTEFVIGDSAKLYLAAVLTPLIAQPTTKRENRSRIAARYILPLSPITNSVVSPTQRRLGASVVKSRSNTLAATG